MSSESDRLCSSDYFESDLSQVKHQDTTLNVK